MGVSFNTSECQPPPGGDTVVPKIQGFLNKGVQQEMLLQYQVLYLFAMSSLRVCLRPRDHYWPLLVVTVQTTSVRNPKGPEFKSSLGLSAVLRDFELAILTDRDGICTYWNTS